MRDSPMTRLEREFFARDVVRVARDLLGQVLVRSLDGTRLSGLIVEVEAYGGPDDLVLAMERGTGFVGKRDGLQTRNVLALYTHVLAPGTPEWATGLLKAAHRYQAGSE